MNFQPLPDKSFFSQIKSQFPSPRDGAGYCWAEFLYVPGNNIPYALNSKEDIISKLSIEYYECRGVPIVQKANFVSGSPWIIPFCVSSFKSDHMKMPTELLPTSIKIYDRKYKLAA